MTIEEAIEADRAGHVQVAARLYEDIVAANSATFEVLMNLAVLYWQTTDFGFSCGNHLDKELIACAGRRYPQLLDAALAAYPQKAEPLFWKMYIAWADLGGNLSLEDCRALLSRDPSAEVVHMHLFAASGGAEGEDAARRLLDACHADGTIRSKYVSSVIEATLRRRGRRAAE